MIKLATSKDIEEINRLGIIFNANFQNTYNISNYLNNKNYIILLNEDSFVNSFMIIYKNLDYYELEAIVVDEDARGKGIASKVINYFLENYTKSGEIILLEVAVNNTAAINLYKKFHFEIISTRKKYYNGIDAYVMKKVI